MVMCHCSLPAELSQLSECKTKMASDASVMRISLYSIAISHYYYHHTLLCCFCTIFPK